MKSLVSHLVMSKRETVFHIDAWDKISSKITIGYRSHELMASV